MATDGADRQAANRDDDDSGVEENGNQASNAEGRSQLLRLIDQFYSMDYRRCSNCVDEEMGGDKRRLFSLSLHKATLYTSPFRGDNVQLKNGDVLADYAAEYAVDFSGDAKVLHVSIVWSRYLYEKAYKMNFVEVGRPSFYKVDFILLYYLNWFLQSFEQMEQKLPQRKSTLDIYDLLKGFTTAEKLSEQNSWSTLLYDHYQSS